MSRFVKNYSKKIGVPAGSLIHVGHKRLKSSIDITEYSTDFFHKKKDVAVSDLFKKSKEDTNVWINIEGIEDEKVISELGEKFSIHRLLLEDILHSDVRPKIEIFDDHIFIALKMISFDSKINEIETEHVSIIFGEKFILSIQEGKEGDVFEPIRKRLEEKNNLIAKRTSDFLAYSLIDSIIDNYFLVLEKISEKMEDLDEVLIKNPSPEVLQKIYSLKREIIFLRKAIWPLREVIAKMERVDTDLIHANTKPYIRDIYDHIIQIIDTEETFRDMISGMMDLYLSSISNRMNEIMKMLSIISTIFIPLTFIAGVYGMNFENMPELKTQYGYHTTILSMLIITIIMLFYFRRKKWI